MRGGARPWASQAGEKTQPGTNNFFTGWLAPADEREQGDGKEVVVKDHHGPLRPGRRHREDVTRGRQQELALANPPPPTDPFVIEQPGLVPLGREMDVDPKELPGRTILTEFVDPCPDQIVQSPLGAYGADDVEIGPGGFRLPAVDKNESGRAGGFPLPALGNVEGKTQIAIDEVPPFLELALGNDDDVAGGDPGRLFRIFAVIITPAATAERKQREESEE